MKNISDFQPRAIDGEPIQVAERADRKGGRRKAGLREALRIFTSDCFDRLNDFIGGNVPAVNNLLAGERPDAIT